MGEDDIVELLGKSGQFVRTQRANSDNPSPPPVLRGSGSGGGSGEENALLPLPQPQPPPSMHHQNLFMQEEEMASWLHHPLRQDYIGSELLYSGAASTPATQPQSSVSLAPPPSSPYGQSVVARREENFVNFWRLRENILTGGRVEAGPVVIESTQMGSSTFPTTESYPTPATHDNESRPTFFGGVSSTFAVPSRDPKEKAVAIETVCEIAGTSSPGVETEPVQIQPATETEIADDRKGKETEETHKTEEARGSTSRKRSRTAEMHNLAEKRRRENINDKIKTLQELIPHCSKSNRASMLEDVIKHVQSLHMQVQMMSGMMSQMYAVNMQQFMPHMAMGMMDMNRPPPFIPFPGTPFPTQAHMAGLSPLSPAARYPFPNFQPSEPSRVHLPSPQPGSNPAPNQPQFPAYMNPYSQFVGLHQTQQPPPTLQSQTTSQPSFGQASSSKAPKDQDNQPSSSKAPKDQDNQPSSSKAPNDQDNQPTG